MVFENATTFPTPEGEQRRCPPPSSTYGFQKLAVEYFERFPKTEVESWRNLQSDNIEFTMKRLREPIETGGG